MLVYAGEIDFDENQHITRWSNMSGTYQCPDNTAFQAGLPLDEFYAVRTDAELRLGGGLKRNPRWFRTENGVVLERILSFTEGAFMEVQASWNQHQSTWLANEHGARECHERLISMLRELQGAISEYGSSIQEKSIDRSHPRIHVDIDEVLAETVDDCSFKDAGDVVPWPGAVPKSTTGSIKLFVAAKGEKRLENKRTA